MDLERSLSDAPFYDVPPHSRVSELQSPGSPCRAPTSPLPLPHDILARVCDFLGDDIRYRRDLRAYSTLARLMRLGSDVYAVAGRALYRQIAVDGESFHGLMLGFMYTSNKGWPNETSHKRKLELFRHTHHLILNSLPLGSTVKWHTQTMEKEETAIFPRVSTVAITNRFLMSISAYAITNSKEPDGENDVEPHPIFGMLRRLSPQSVCLAYPKWKHRDKWTDSIDVKDIRPWINLTDFNNHQEPSDFEISFWGKIQLRRHFVAIMSRSKEQRDVMDLLHAWKPNTVTLHHFDFAKSPRPPYLECDTLRIFSCADMCSEHPLGRYTHRPQFHLSDCLANRSSYWFKAGEMLHNLSKLNPRPRRIELADVGETLLLACKCRNAYDATVEDLKTMLRDSAKPGILVDTPPFNEAEPCECCPARPRDMPPQTKTPPADPLACVRTRLVPS